MPPNRSPIITIKLPVGQGHVPAAYRNTDNVQICSSMLSSAYAVGGDMSPPYNAVSFIVGASLCMDCEARIFPPPNGEAKREKLEGQKCKLQKSAVS